MGLLDQLAQSAGGLFSSQVDPRTGMSGLDRLSMIGALLKDATNPEGDNGAHADATARALALRQQTAQNAILVRQKIAMMRGAVDAFNAAGSAGQAASSQAGASGRSASVPILPQPSVSSFSAPGGPTSIPFPEGDADASAPLPADFAPPPSATQPSSSQSGPQRPPLTPLDMSGVPMLPGAHPSIVTPQMRRGAAMMALVNEHPEQAISILDDDDKITQGADGWLYSSKSGQVVGRLPSHTTVNGWRTDLGDSNAPAYYPTLPQGMGPDGRGAVSNLPGYNEGIASSAAATAAGTEGGKLPFVGPAAQAQSAGTAAGEAPYKVVQIPMADGSTVTMTLAQLLGSQGGTGGAVGAASLSGFGRTPTATDSAYAAKAGQDAASLIASAPELRTKAISTSQTARQGLNLAKTLNPSLAVPVKQAAAEGLRALGMSSTQLDQFAGQAKDYRAVTTQLLLNNAKALGANPSNRDAQITAQVFPSLTSPGSAATMFFATQAATADQQQAYADFLAGYKGPKDPQAIQQAWISSPAGQRSIFQNPVFGGLSVNGMPLVLKTPRPASDGYYYGQVNVPGPKPYRFRIIP